MSIITKRVRELRAIAGDDDVYYDARNGQYYIRPFGWTKFVLGDFETAKSVFETKTIRDFAQEVLDNLSEARIRWALSYYEMEQERLRRNLAKMRRGHMCGWEEFIGHPDNLKFAREVAMVIEMLNDE